MLVLTRNQIPIDTRNNKSFNKLERPHCWAGFLPCPIPDSGMSPISNPKGVFLKIQKHSKLAMFSAASFAILHDLPRACFHTNTGGYIQVSCAARKCNLCCLTIGFDLHPKAYCYFISRAAGYQLISLLSSRSHNLRGKGRALPSEEHCLSYFKSFSVHIGKD